MRDKCYRWICCLAIVLASAAATAWSDGRAQPAAATTDTGTTKSARPISCTDPCNVKLFEEAILAFERPGILGAIDVQEGDLVHSGQFVAKLQDDVAKASLAVAEETAASDIDIRYAEVAAEVAQTEVDKMVAANKKVAGTVPDVDVQRGRLNAVKTALEVEKAKHTRDLNVLKAKEAAAQLATYRLEAPFEGFVSRVHLTKGASVKQGDPVLKLVSTRKMKVEGFVTVRDAALLRHGAKVHVEPILPAGVGAGGEAGKSFPGKLVFIDVETTPVRGTVRVWAEVENVDNLLRAGLTATMTILPSPRE
jgi:RND family efflux transporter MFP subunit